MAKNFWDSDAVAPAASEAALKPQIDGGQGTNVGIVDENLRQIDQGLKTVKDPSAVADLQSQRDEYVRQRARLIADPAMARASEPANNAWWNADKPAAQQNLPAGVTPSTAGAGRGSVNPAPVQQSGVSTQPQTAPINFAPDTDPLATVTPSTAGNTTFTATATPDAGAGRGFVNPPRVGESIPQRSGSLAKDLAINVAGGAAGGVAGAGAALAEAAGASDTAASLDEIRKNWQGLQKESGGDTIPGKAASLVGAVAPAFLVPAVKAAQLVTNAGLFAIPAFRDTLKSQLDEGKSFPLALAHASEDFGINLFLPTVATRGSGAVVKALGAADTAGAKGAVTALGQAAGEGAAFSAASSIAHKATDTVAGAPNDKDWIDLQDMAASALGFTALRGAHVAPQLAGAIADRAGSPSQQFGRALAQDTASPEFDERVAQGRIDRLRAAGEDQAAKLMESRLASRKADGELATMGSVSQDPKFQAAYRAQRMSGAKPAEAAARASMTTGFDSLAGAAEIPDAAVSAAHDKAADLPLDKVPGFFERFIASLTSKGLGKPLPAGTVDGAIGAARDQAVNAALDGVYSPAAMLEKIKRAADAKPDPDKAARAEPNGRIEPTFDTGNDVALTPEAEAAHQAATSPLNDLPEPSQAQKDAGNYKVGRLNIAGLDISVENPQGSVRRGVAPDGTPWETPLQDHYGYIRGTVGADKDHLDVFVKPGTPSDFKGPVFVVDQVDPATGRFDEHKAVLGAVDKAKAEQIYRRNYGPDWQGLGAITELPMPAFKAWAKSAHAKEPLGEVPTGVPNGTRAAEGAPAAGPSAEGSQQGADRVQPAALPGAPDAALPVAGRDAGAAEKVSEPYESLGATGTRSKSGDRARSRAWDANPFMAFLGKHGVSIDERSEFAPGPTEQRKAMVQGYGPIFRGNGEPIDTLAHKAIEEGFLPIGESDGDTKLRNMITSALGGERIIPQYAEGAVEADMQHRIEVQRMNEEEAVADLSEVAENSLDVIDQALDDKNIPWDEPSNVSTEAAMRAMGFSDKEIEDEVARESGRTQENSQGGGKPRAAAGEEAPGTGGRREGQARSEGVDAAGEHDDRPAGSRRSEEPAGGRSNGGGAHEAAGVPVAAGPAADARSRDAASGGGTTPAKLEDQARVAQTPADAGVFTWERRPSGTLAVTGDPEAVRTFLTEGGIGKMMISKSGVLVGKTEAERAEKLLSNMPPDSAPASASPQRKPDVLDGDKPFRTRQIAEAFLKSANNPKPNRDGTVPRRTLRGYEVVSLSDGGFALRAPAKTAAPEKGLRVGIPHPTTGIPEITEPVTVKDGVVYIGKAEAINFDTGEAVKVKAGASDADIKQALKDAGALSRRQKFFGGAALGKVVNEVDNQPVAEPLKVVNGEPLAAPTEADLAAAQEREANAPALDEKAQIDREAEHQTLTKPTAPEQRKDTTGDLLGGPTAAEALEAKRKAEEARAKKTGTDDGTAPLFAREGEPLFKRPELADVGKPALNPRQVRYVLAPALRRLTIPHDLRSIDESRAATGAEIPPDAKGMYYKGTLHVFTDNVHSPLQAEAVFWHEVQHAGMDAIYGAGSRSYEQALRSIASQNANIREAAKAWRVKYGREDYHARIDAGATHEQALLRTKLQAVDEALAEMSSRNVKIEGLPQFIAKVQEFLRSIGLERMANWLEGKTDAQALSMILNARAAVMKEPKPQEQGQLAPAFSREAGKLRELADAARQAGNTNKVVEIGAVSADAVNEARRHGIEIDGYKHTVDLYAVRHALSKHGDEQTELARGQVAVTSADVAHVPDVIAAPDARVYGAMTTRKQPIIASIKHMPDGSTMVMEEVRTGQKTLALVSLRKYPAGKDTDSVARTLLSNARSNGGDKLIVVKSGGDRAQSPAASGERPPFAVSPQKTSEAVTNPSGQSKDIVSRGKPERIALLDSERKRLEGSMDAVKAVAPEARIEDGKLVVNAENATAVRKLLGTPPIEPGAFSRADTSDETGDDQPQRKPYTGPGAKLIESTKDVIGRLVNDAFMSAAPMSAGSDAARAIAKDYANAERVARTKWTMFDDVLKKQFTEAQRKKMWEAADEQNVLLQTGADTAGKGLDRLAPKERAVMDSLHEYGEQLLQRAKEVAMFKGDGLPYWTPRMAVMIGGDGEFAKIPGEGKQATAGGVGRNVTTTAGSLKQRKYLTAEETEAAADALAKAKGGQGAQLVRDIRTMPMAMARLERAIAGRELIDQIKELGISTGIDTTSNQRGPNFFTLDHPAFQEYRYRPDVKFTEAMDKHLWQGLLDFAEKIGVNPERVATMRGRKWGYASTAGEVVTRFGGPETVLTHELGHQLDFKYGLADMLTKRGITAKELRALADLRYEGSDASATFKKYVRQGTEKIANMVHAYVHAKDRFAEVAPNTLKAFDSFLDEHPELADLKKIRASLVLDTEQFTKRPPGEDFDVLPIYVSKDFEGPLKSILSETSGELYKAMMALKGKSMGLIMYSPLIHNAVEWGRALPMMPGKVITFQIYFSGNKLKNDPIQMMQAVRDGLVPIGHRGNIQDITGLAEEPSLAPGRSWTAKLLGGALSAPLRPLSKGAAQSVNTAVKKGVDAAGDFWHNTLLWDRVGDLQAGLYGAIKSDLTRKGMGEDTAGRLAAHFANRYAGALPNEAMSVNARKIANFVLFSRSFTLGNLGVMKDMVTGFPADVAAQIKRDAGEDMLKTARSIGRRKAIAAFGLDIALMYAGNALLQSALDKMKRDKSLDEIEKGYLERFESLIKRTKESPLDVLSHPLDAVSSLTPNSANEPDRQDRIHYGTDDKGTHIYARMPTGKIGEEFKNWITSPLQTLLRKQGTVMRPITQTIENDKGFGQRVYNPDDPTWAGLVKNMGRVVWNFMSQQIPLDSVQSAVDLARGKGDDTDKLKALGPLAGVTFSKGAPGGPEVGEMYHENKVYQGKVADIMPDVRQALKLGDEEKAIKLMESVGMSDKKIDSIIRKNEDPQSRLNSKALKDYYKHASEESQKRMDNYGR